jgi:hypothetical protein
MKYLFINCFYSIVCGFIPKALDIAVEYTQITNKGQAPQLESTNYILTKHIAICEQILKTRRTKLFKKVMGTTSTVVYPKGDDEILLYRQTKKSNFKDVIATRTVGSE